MVNWNKPAQPSTTIYISPKLRKFLLKRTDSEILLQDWLARIQAYVEALIKANLNSSASGFRTGELTLLGKIVANAMYEITEENLDAELIEYTVFFGFSHEDVVIERMFPLVLKRLSKSS